MRLPRELRFEGDRVRSHRAGRGALVERVFANVSGWFAEIDRFASEPFMPDGRRQPPAPTNGFVVSAINLKLNVVTVKDKSSNL